MTTDSNAVTQGQLTFDFEDPVFVSARRLSMSSVEPRAGRVTSSAETDPTPAGALPAAALRRDVSRQEALGLLRVAGFPRAGRHGPRL